MLCSRYMEFKDRNKSDLSLVLLRVALWNEGDAKASDIARVGNDSVDSSLANVDWNTVVAFFKKQALSGLLPDAVAFLPIQLQPSIKLKMSMIAQQLQIEQMNHSMNGELVAFVEKLENREIPYLLLKGQGVASLYPHPSHRLCGDIDIYVPMEHLKEVGKEFLAFGAVRTAESRHHVNFRARGIAWELHHSIYYFQKKIRNQIFMKYVDEEMRKDPSFAVIEGKQVRVLSPTMNALLLLSHIVDHFYCEGVGLRQLCDYALLLHHHRNDIDKELLLQYLEELSLLGSYRIFGCICVHYLGVPRDDLMLEPTPRDMRIAHRVMADCMSGGNFGRADSNSRQTLWQNVVFYTRFLRRLWSYRQVCPGEAFWWPLAKAERVLKDEVHVSEEKSVLNRFSK